MLARTEYWNLAVFFNGRRTFGQWEPKFIELHDPSIAFLEPYGVCVGILTWQKETANQRILIRYDNQAAVQMMINNMTSSCHNCMYLIRILTLNNMLHRRQIKAVYISTKDNYLSDLLSRMKTNAFFAVAPGFTRRLPEPLPITNLATEQNLAKVITIT